MCILKFITLLRHVSSGPMMGEVSLETVPLNILAHDVINLLHIYIYIYVKTYIVFIKVYITVKCFMLKCFQEKSFFTFTITIDR